MMKKTHELMAAARAWRWPSEQLEPYERERAKERQIRKPSGSVVAHLPPQDEGKSRDHLAKLAGVSGKAERTGSNYDN